MKRISFVFLLLLSTTCTHKKPDSLLWLIPLLGSGNNISEPTPEGPINPPDSLLPTFIQITILKPESVDTYCPMYGGLFIQFTQGAEKTCSPIDWNPSCINIGINGNGTQTILDPRTYIGIDFSTNIEVDPSFFPKDKRSNLFCFSRPIPQDTNHIKMYSFQNQSKNISLNNCYNDMNDNICIDKIPLLGSVEFKMPKEFPILISDGNGHAGSHTLELNYVTEENFYTTCTYVGNEHKSVEGFTKNAYISGDPDAKGRNGYCIQCEFNYCNSIDPINGIVVESTPVNQFNIPVGEIVLAKSEITLSVIKGQGPYKHTVQWTIENFRQLVSSNQMAILPANSILLFWFLIPSLIMIFYFYNKKWKHWLRKN
ncbi:hypothetical protein ND861_12785 [Leptospira sp. 2 VSF19]|uniref:Uncharacterized protein n=1 Tax=Leptospira soteropolitanensis TaxID=2950025 RepID=A0AAW5VID5_9LEPT|nr:hypothetical protein [Leptospira soteropolitanensis]MCW7493517.1 hypothetical protein [Leptospira soteropolitanensis]MCW7500951.1 hypothetical protein [Leptospira soteropolitanensis]MCW7523369.1 hypothetical protein [Leptospira soteropolitanensis]MCW7527230.1 hypothetical protein [Leptospira soteropolitanensis]MCW7531087.1 hypothetical protein [Leptospira soteropolitanensis]